MKVSHQSNPQRAPRTRGSVMAMIIIISVVITGFVLAIALGTSVLAASIASRSKTDEAFYAADGALQWAICELRADPSWRPGSTAPVVNGWTCTITCTDMGTPTGLLGNPLKFTVVARKSGVESAGTSSATVTGALAYVPQFWSIGNLSIAQSVDLAGDVETLGDLTVNAPSSGSVKTKGAKGNVKVKGVVVDNNPGPAGSQKYFTNTPIGSATVTTPSQTAQQVFNALKAGPTISIMSVLTYINGQPVIDFTKAGGKPVIYSGVGSYVGNVGIINSSNPANDTFIVESSTPVCNFTGAFPFNATTATVNIVMNSDVSFNGSGTGINITGSFYVAGDWVQAGKYAFKGTVMVDQTTTLGGTGSIDVQAPPSFDPRYIPRISSYTGILP